MRLRVSLMVLAFAAIPSVAAAQRGGAGRGAQIPHASELEDHSPVGVVLDKRKKLSLSDSQLTALKGIAKALHEKDADAYKMWDSLRLAMNSAGGSQLATGAPRGRSARTGPISGRSGGGSSDAGVALSGGGASDAKMVEARSMMQALVGPLQDNDEWSRQEVLRLLTDEQKAKAEQLWKDDADDFKNGIARPRGGPGGERPPGV